MCMCAGKQNREEEKKKRQFSLALSSILSDPQH